MDTDGYKKIVQKNEVKIGLFYLYNRGNSIFFQTPSGFKSKRVVYQIFEKDNLV